MRRSGGGGPTLNEAEGKGGGRLKEKSKRGLRIAALTALALFVLGFAYVLRTVFTPVLMGLLLAYVLTPVVDLIEKARVHRVLAIIVLCFLVAVSLVAAVRYSGPIVLGELGALFDAVVGDAYEPPRPPFFDLYEPWAEHEDKPEAEAEGPPPRPEDEEAEIPSLVPGAEDEPADAPPSLPEQDPFDYIFPDSDVASPSEADPPWLPFTFPPEYPDGYRPGYLKRLQMWGMDMVENWNERFADRPDLQISMDTLIMRFRDYLRESLQDVREVSEEAFKKVRSGVYSFLAFLGFMALVPIYAFFFLMGIHEIPERILEYVPYLWRERTRFILGEIHEAISSFFRRRLLICLVIGFLTAGVLYLFGVRFWLVLGIMMGVFNIVPVAGPALVFVPIFILALIDQGILTAILVTLGCWGIQLIDAFVFTPTILGTKARLHPVTIIISLFVGGIMFGAFGVLLAIPVAAIIKILCRELVLPELKTLADEGAPPGAQAL